MEERERRVVDLAYRIDPELASSLVALNDSDPVRVAERRQRARRRVKVLKMGADAKVFDEDSSGEDTDLPEASWLALGALNAGTGKSLDFKSVHDRLRRSGRLPLTLAYPVVCLCLESMVDRLRSRDKVERGLVFLTALVESAGLAIR